MINPFGLLHAVIAALGGVFEAFQKGRRAPDSRRSRRFLVVYFLALALGLALVAWVFHDLYGSR